MRNILLFLIYCFIISKSLSFGQKEKELFPNFPFVNQNNIKLDNVPLDKEGIPMLELNNELIYYPVQYNQIALHYYADFLRSKKKRVKERFLNQAKFIKNEISHYKDFSVWECDKEIPGYNLSIPWGSSMAQGFGIGVMLQAYGLTGEEEYLQVAKKGIKAYEYDLSKKGIKNSWDGYDFYEEYADKESHVLNGYIFSLAGLYYYNQVIKDNKSKKLFDIGIETLKAKINEFDANFTSYYSKLSEGGYKYASSINDDPDHYHELVIYQLLTLYSWTNEEIFYEYAHKFLKYDTGKVTKFYDQNKFKSIKASYTLDSLNYGVDKLNDELWSWGNYWSTNKAKTDLIIDFGKEVEDISQVVFYSTSQQTLPKKFDVAISNKNGKWETVLNSESSLNSYLKRYKTGKYKTFINGYIIEGKPKGRKLRITFHSNKKNLVTLREINVHFNRSKVLKQILNLAHKEKISLD